MTDTEYRIENDDNPWNIISNALPFADPLATRMKLSEIRGALRLLRQEVETKDSSLAFWHGQAAELSSELDAFKDTVREAAIAAAKDNGLCGEGLNEWLESVGLEPAKQMVQVRVRETAARWLEFDIEVTDPDDEDEVARAVENEWEHSFDRSTDFDEDNELEYESIEVLS